ncbi:hypothetical protein DFH08DRAFT_817397 [Mycena albidolilacea]|uniref:Uncharacterized protein n=1 Tax=Mycena albidolilacea TaxID=1033008 RepID=A0AAD7EH45_9AGAR|nr:hypothetical protein DFH08DRAFT_817397 [Mycena albidolilacea]
MFYLLPQLCLNAVPWPSQPPTNSLLSSLHLFSRYRNTQRTDSAARERRGRRNDEIVIASASGSEEKLEKPSTRGDRRRSPRDGWMCDSSRRVGGACGGARGIEAECVGGMTCCGEWHGAGVPETGGEPVEVKTAGARARALCSQRLCARRGLVLKESRGSCAQAEIAGRESIGEERQVDRWSLGTRDNTNPAAIRSESLKSSVYRHALRGSLHLSLIQTICDWKSRMRHQYRLAHLLAQTDLAQSPRFVLATLPDSVHRGPCLSRPQFHAPLTTLFETRVLRASFNIFEYLPRSTYLLRSILNRLSIVKIVGSIRAAIVSKKSPSLSHLPRRPQPGILS